MNFQRACLEFEAGLLDSRSFPALACEALAAGRDGEALRGLAALVGEPAEAIRQWEQSFPDLEKAMAAELQLPARQTQQALWDLVRMIAGSVTEGERMPRDAGELVALAKRAGDENLEQEVRRIEGMLDQWHYVPARPAITEEVLRECRRLSETEGIPAEQRH